MDSIKQRLIAGVGECALVMALGIAGAVAYALVAGQDANWDFLNYHYYMGFAVLSGRLESDVLMAQLQTFLNPALDVGHYVLMGNLAPRLASVLLAGIHGTNFLLVYLIARSVVRIPHSWSGTLTCVAAAVGGVTGPMFLSEIGTTFGDSVTSLLVLGALLTLTRAAVAGQSGSISTGRVVLAGILAGLAVGLKLTNMVYLLALTAALVSCRQPVQVTIRSGASFLLSAAAAALVAHGPWSLYLLSSYGSPLFPFYNGVFRSPNAELRNIQTRGFAPDSVGEALLYPFHWAIGEHSTAELVFRDVRFALIEVLLAMCLSFGLVTFRTGQRAGVEAGRHSLFSASGRRVILVFCAVAFATWMQQFSIQRYIVALELLSVLVIGLLVDFLIRSQHLRMGLIAGLTTVVAVTSRPPEWGRLPWASDWFGVDSSALRQDNHILLVGIGSEPIAYSVPFLPEGTRSVRIDGNFRPKPGSSLERTIRTAVASHAGPIRTLGVRAPGEADRNRLAEFGLAAVGESCVEIPTRIERLVSCPLGRV